MSKITMTLYQLQSLLDEQKRLVIDRLRSYSYLYNTNSTSGQSIPMTIDEEKMKEVGMKTSYPDAYTTLKAYLPE